MANLNMIGPCPENLTVKPLGVRKSPSLVETRRSFELLLQGFTRHVILA
jgi:hypothetical protein